MSSLPNVIKASQYTNSGVREVKLSELDSSQRHNEPAGVPAVRRDAGQSQEAILQEALEQAKNIVENARSYTMNQLRESTAQMNEEASRIRAAGYQEGFSKGSAEGFEKGHSEGYEKGFEQGLQEGREAGIQELQEQSDQQREEIARLIEDLRLLSRVSRLTMNPAPIDVTPMAVSIVEGLRQRDKGRAVALEIESSIRVHADPERVGPGGGAVEGRRGRLRRRWRRPAQPPAAGQPL